jgi:P4 family phage/plasmid primase-like protien
MSLQRNNNVIFCQSLHDAFAQVAMPFPKRMPESGRFTRFPTSEKQTDDAGWCRLYPDGTGAVFGDFRSGTSYLWQQRDPNAPPPTDEERQAARVKADAARHKAVAERAAEQAKAKQTASRLWAESVALQATHPYVARKGIAPFGARQSTTGDLMLPVYGPDDELHSLQFIDDAGEKRSLWKGKMKSGRLMLGDAKDGSPLILCEGWATGCSVHQATGHPTAICFSGRNLATVAESLRLRYPNSRLVVAGDLDSTGAGAKFADAALAVASNSTAVYPSFADGRDHGDFNDLHQDDGIDAVNRRISAAIGAMALPFTDVVGPIRDSFSPPTLSKTDVRDGTATTRPLSELGNAYRMLDLVGDRLRYVYDVKKWLKWDGTAWTWDSDGASVRALAANLPAIILEEAREYLADAEHFAKWSRQSQKEKTIKASVSLLQDFEQIRLPSSHIDADILKVGFDDARQMIDLDTGEVRPTTPADLITKSLNVSSIANPTGDMRWMQFLSQVFENDDELIDWLQRFCGYLLTGSTQEQFFLFCYGHGANGKSVFIETLKYIMGDYGRAIAPETLCATRRQAGAATPDLVPLIGARLAMSSETEDNANMAESLVKGLVSGDTMSVRANYGSQIQFTPMFKLIMAGNHQPRINGVDSGIWRRVRLVPFNKTFAPEQRDPQLLSTLKMEAPAILGWMLQGCLAWKKRGLSDTPRAIREATDVYRQDQDITGKWLSDCTVKQMSGETLSTALYANYKSWAMDNGFQAASSHTLSRRLRERGFEPRKSNGKTWWPGLVLTDSLGWHPNIQPVVPLVSPSARLVFN